MRDTSVQTTASVPRPVIVGLSLLGALLVGATLLMWVHYGTAVFYEIIVAGIQMCL